MKSKNIQSGRINQKLETRDKILASATFFLNKGIDFNLDDVAKKAGISRATIYRYYSNTEVLSSEAGLDINTQSPETVFKNLQHQNLDQILLGVQDYFNTLAIDHENAFRKYLGISIGASSSEIKRGARRKKTLQLALENTKLTQNEKEKIANLLTHLMGIEPLIVCKDVCGLTNDQSKELLKWGMTLILKGLHINREI